MSKTLLSLFFASIIFIIPFFVYAAIGTPFGGQIVAVAPCPLNPSALLVTLSLGPSKEIVVYQTGKSRSYLYGPPASPGQWLLGIRVPLGITCPGTGLIDFHGSSKPGF